MPAILATWEAEIRRVMVQGQSGQIVHETPSPKITMAKWTGGVALLCKHRALSSNTGPTKKKGKLHNRKMCEEYEHADHTVRNIMASTCTWEKIQVH
jgi:hypothetical protein